MTKNRLTLMLAAVASTVAANNALAVDPQSLVIGGTVLTPTLSVSEAYDDNVWAAPGKDVDSMVTTIAPSLLLGALDGLNSYLIRYDLVREEVHSSSDDSHTDHDFLASAHLEINARNRLDFNANYVKRTARRDTTNRLFGETGNKSKSFDVGAMYGFGAESARTQIELGVNKGRLRYDNNFNSGSFTREKERDTTGLNTTLYYRLTGKTKALAEVIYTDYDYESAASLLNGDSRAYRAGLEWEATAKTTGRVSVGREHKRFDKGSQSSLSKPSWAASVEWQPRTYSTFTLGSYRLIEEGSATETSIDTTSTDLGWVHDWTSDLSSNIGYTIAKQDYDGLSNNGREDDIDTARVGLTYKMLRWMDVGLNYQFHDTESNDPNSEYDRNVVGLNITVSL